MSRIRFALMSLTVVMFGILGVWLGSASVDSADIRRWLGLSFLLVGFFGLVVIYRRDLRPSHREKEIEWQRIKACGKFRLVLNQLLWSQVVWLPVLFGGVYELYQTRAVTLPPPWWLVLAAISAAFSFVWSLTWWRRHDVGR